MTPEPPTGSKDTVADPTAPVATTLVGALGTDWVTFTVSVVVTFDGVSALSLAEQLTGVFPGGKKDVCAGTQVTVAGSKLSVAVGKSLAGTYAPNWFCAGIVMSGTSVIAKPGSFTTMCSVVDAVLGVARLSVAVQVTVVVPIGNVEPEAPPTQLIAVTGPAESDAVIGP